MKMRNFLVGLLPFLLASKSKNESTKENRVTINPKFGNGYTGFLGSNADKKHHFNKKHHGQMLKIKHRKAA